MLLEGIAERYGMLYKLKNARVILSAEHAKLEFILGSRWCTLKGTNVALMYPVKSAPPGINDMDFRLTIEPLILPEILGKHKLKRLMLDPGHGGGKNGCINSRYKEKDLNLIYAEKLRRELETLGYEVVLTRNTDKDVDLEERARLAAAKKVDLFISLHINALSPFESEAEGIETYCMTPAGGYSTNSGEIYGCLHSRKSFPGNKHDLNNFALAYCIQTAMVETAGAPDRAVRRANFAVLRNNSVPAVLVESGYLTNPKEAKLLVSDAYQNKIVKGIAAGIQEYEKLLK